MEYNIGDIVQTKKQHPCGSKLWELTRVGVDFKLKCLGCDHVITVERQKALKMIVRKKWNKIKGEGSPKWLPSILEDTTLSQYYCGTWQKLST